MKKLLLKGKNFSQRFSDDSRMQLVNRDGNSYWVPVEREKINSLKTWEQAFRVYAVICSRANPHRSHEIWQYIHVISTASASYIWDNVAEYDCTFQQLMSNYPVRSWAKIYNQMWNLAMKDPISKVVKHNYSQGSRGDSSKTG